MSREWNMRVLVWCNAFMLFIVLPSGLAGKGRVERVEFLEEWFLFTLGAVMVWMVVVVMGDEKGRKDGKEGRKGA